MTIRVFIMAAILVIMAVSLSVALPPTLPIPTQLSYQGRLTSSTGTPITGTKNLTFKIYDGGGAMLWLSGSVAVSCSDGLFSVILGGPGMPAITPDVLTDPAATLGITVESDPELSPRTPLTSSAFSYTALVAPLYLPLGGGTLTGDVNWDFGTRDVRVQNFGSSTALTLTGPVAPAVQLLSNDNGSLTIRSSSSATNVTAVSSPTTGGGIAIYSAAGNPTHMFNGESGNGATVLPDNSISAQEILNEPGIVRGVGNPSDSLAYGTWTDFVTVTITTPADGYVYLSGQCFASFDVGVSYAGGQQGATIYIDDGTGVLDNFAARIEQLFSVASIFNYPITLSRVFYETAGAHTFTIRGIKNYSNGIKVWAAWPILNAMYFPTSYGTVSTVASSPEAGQFESAKAISTGDGRTVYQVDLRDLELKAAKERAEAEKAERILMEAKLSPPSSGQANR